MSFLKKLTTLLPLIILSLIPSSSLLANCELVEWGIHTIAEYREDVLTPINNKIYLKYHLYENSFLIKDPASETGEFLQSINDKISSLQYQNQQCPLIQKPQIIFSEEGGTKKYLLTVPSCLASQLSIPTHGTILYDVTESKLTIPNSLFIGPMEKLQPDQEKLLEQTLKNKNLYLNAANQTLPINQTEVQKISFKGWQIGNTPQNSFKVYEAQLIFPIKEEYLKNLAELQDKKPLVIGKPIIFYVLFLQNTKGTLFYIADSGGGCSEYHLIGSLIDDDKVEKNPSPITKSSVPQLTQAFDTNNDGQPNLIELNQETHYLLTEENGLIVVNDGGLL